MRTKTGAWNAYYGGRCASCNRTFKVGTLVRYEGGVIIEDECDQQVPEEDAGLSPVQRQVYREAMCMSCFTVHAPGQKGCQ